MYFFFFDMGEIGPAKSNANFSKGSMDIYVWRGISYEGTGLPIL